MWEEDTKCGRMKNGMQDMHTNTWSHDYHTATHIQDMHTNTWSHDYHTDKHIQDMHTNTWSHDYNTDTHILMHALTHDGVLLMGRHEC